MKDFSLRNLQNSPNGTRAYKLYSRYVNQPHHENLIFGLALDDVMGGIERMLKKKKAAILINRHKIELDILRKDDGSIGKNFCS